MWLGQSKQTATRSQNNDPVFDETLAFAASDVTVAELDQAVLVLRVSDSDAFGFSADLIGEFEMACTELYKWRAHELHRQARRTGGVHLLLLSR
jgi:hypothetical protein